MQRTSWLARQLLASRKRPSSIELVGFLVSQSVSQSFSSEPHTIRMASHNISNNIQDVSEKRRIFKVPALAIQDVVLTKLWDQPVLNFYLTGGNPTNWCSEGPQVEVRKVKWPSSLLFFLRLSSSLSFSSTLSYNFFFLLWRCDPTRVVASSFLRFLDHTQRRITVSRTPLEEWSARRRDLYLTTHNTHNRQTSMPPVGFEPTISVGERPQNYTLDRLANGTGIIQSSEKICQ